MPCPACEGAEMFFEENKCEQCGYDRHWSIATRALYIKLSQPHLHFKNIIQLVEDDVLECIRHSLGPPLWQECKDEDIHTFQDLLDAEMKPEGAEMFFEVKGSPDYSKFNALQNKSDRLKRNSQED